jgi:hypothetical protein
MNDRRGILPSARPPAPGCKNAGVEILWMTRANPVENRTGEKILRADPVRSARGGDVDGAFVHSFA